MAKYKKRSLPAGYGRIREWLEYDGDPRRPSAPKLWDADKVIYERLIQLRTLLFQKAHDYHDAMKVMMKPKEKGGYGISEATYNRDYRGLIHVFGDMMQESKEFEKLRLKSTAFKILQKALSTNDLKSANSAMANLIKLGGHDRDDAEKIPLEMLNPGAYALVIDDAGQKALAAMTSSGPVLDLTAMMQQEAEDIEHEEIQSEEAVKE